MPTRNALAACVAVGCALGSFATPSVLAHDGPQVQVDPAAVEERPAIDVALLLDTSNSMDGLIHQAKAQLWGVVGEFAKSHKHGQAPRLRVALFEYGNNTLPASEGYIRQVVPLTSDLDKLSEALFSLTTNGGDEYCGQVIDQALTRLDWSQQAGAYKTIFIAGNEPFTQGEVDYREACKRAIQTGVVVNTIHCGDSHAGASGMWGHAAQLAEGRSLNINQDETRTVRIETPHDRILIELNAELNKTYLFYGDAEARDGFSRNQAVQDGNAMRLGAAVLAQRSAAKAGSAYVQADRDLVDAMAVNPEVLADLEEEALPAPVAELPEAERAEFVADMATRRAELQVQIAEATRLRDAYVAEERRKLAEEAGEE
ncbi:MAG: vWA domain-containing protein, partial [Planctomycetota bacterium]